jgi:Na+/melibiose symporter-like transporter
MGLINMLLNDAIDFIMLKDKISLNGTLSAIKGFSFKLGGAIGNTLILQVLALTGYIAGAVGHQPEITLVGINAMRFITPTLSAVVIIICLLKYPFEKYYKEIEEMKSNLDM